MNTYFTADTHFQHERIIELMGRPFVSVQDHDAQIIHWINETVGERDKLYILGDFAMKDPEGSRKAIRCKNVIFIWGNHDHNRLKQVYPEITDVLEHRFPIGAESQKIFMSHYPHAFWPASHKGSIHLYGHCHGMREATLDACFPLRRSIDVGVDVAKKLVGEYRPFALSEILEIVNARSGHDPVEWYKAGNHHLEAVCAGEPLDTQRSGGVSRDSVIEECARVADNYGLSSSVDPCCIRHVRDCAAAIRARSKR